MVFIFLAYFTLYNGLQRERVEREVGGGIGMGNTCKPMAVSFQCMTKIHYKKKKEKKVKAAAAAAAVASIVSDSVQPHRRQPTRLLCPWDSPGKNTGVGCHFLLQCMHAC